jgi:hypothetical protein
MNQASRNAPIAPNRTGEENGEAIHLAPSGDAPAQLFELPGVQVRKPGRMMMEQFVGDETIGACGTSIRDWRADTTWVSRPSGDA